MKHNIFLKRLVFIFLLVFFNYSAANIESNIKIWFSPNDNVTKNLIKELNNAKSKIYAAVYMITDKKIAQALADAKVKRGVDVQVITDQSCLEYEYGKVDFLKENGVDIFVYKSSLKKKRNHSEQIMHNKFVIIDDELITGSFNWTVQADARNYENVICMVDKLACKKYLDQFEILKKNCVRQAMNLITQKNKTNTQVIKETSVSFKNKLVDFLKDLKEKVK